MEKKRDTIKINYIFNILYQLLAVLMPIITAPYISRKLGVVNVGYYSNVAAIVSYFTLFANLGIYTYGRREIGSLQNNKDEYSRAFWSILEVKLIVGFVILLVYGIFVHIYSKFTVLFLIQTFSILSQILDISWFFQGLENYRITVTYQTIVKIVGVIAIFIFIMGPDDLNKYTFIMSFLSFAGTISVYPFLSKYVLKPQFDFKVILKHFVGSVVLFVPQIATSLYMSVDKTMIGYFYIDGVQNGLYEQATKIDIIGLYIVISLTGVLIPRLSLYHKEKNIEALNNSSGFAIRYIMFIGCPLAFGISGIGYNILPWFLGPGYGGSSNILQISAFIIVVMGLTNYLGYGYLIATRQQSLYTVTVFTGLTINVIINSILIPPLGGVGAAVASLISETAVLLFQIIVVSKQLDLKRAFSGTWRYVFLGFGMGVVVLTLSKFLEATIINSIIVFVIGVAMYIIPLLILKDVYAMKLLTVSKRLVMKLLNKDRR